MAHKVIVTIDLKEDKGGPETSDDMQTDAPNRFVITCRTFESAIALAASVVKMLWNEHRARQ